MRAAPVIKHYDVCVGQWTVSLNIANTLSNLEIGIPHFWLFSLCCYQCQYIFYVSGVLHVYFCKNWKSKIHPRLDGAFIAIASTEKDVYQLSTPNGYILQNLVNLDWLRKLSLPEIEQYMWGKELSVKVVLSIRYV